VTKLQAWEYSSADEVLYLDSDLVLIHDLEPTTRSGIIEVRPWDDAGDAAYWRPITEHLLGVVTPYETMVRHPFQYPVQLVRRCLEHIGGVDRFLGLGRTTHFSEFNLLGNYAYLLEHRSVTCIYWQPEFVKQFYSYDGLTPAVEDVLRDFGYWEDTP